MSQGYCTGCGAALMQGSAFCAACGAPAAGTAQPRPAPHGQQAAAPPPHMPPPPAEPTAPTMMTAQAQPAYAPPPAPAAYAQPQPIPYAQPQPSKQNNVLRWVIIFVGVGMVLVGLARMLNGFNILTGGGSRSSSAPTAKDRADADADIARAQGASVVVGRWAPDSSCREVTTLSADGGFISPNGRIGRWTLQGDLFTLTGSGGSQSMRLVASPPNSLTFLYSDGVRETQVRC